MTITHEPQAAPGNDPRGDTASVSIHYPHRNVRIDTTFWQHRSIFAGSQEQLNELRREAEERAAARGRKLFAEYVESLHEKTRRQTFEAHRPAIRRLKPVLHVGFVPLLWAITTCKCGDRWPCNSVKQYFRSRLGWTVDITEHLDNAARNLPKPATRWSRFVRFVTRRGRGSG